MFECMAGNTPSLTDAYKRQKRMGKEYDEQRAILRRVLRRYLSEDTPPDTKTMEKQLCPAAKDFIVAAYGDLTEYLTNKIEAEVRSQKNGETLLVGIPAE